MPTSFHLALSPDERRLAMRVIDPQVRTRDIWLLDRARDITTRFTFETSNQNYPIWSPDGKRIAYWNDGKEAAGIVAKQLTGSGETELLAPIADESVLKDWSRDGGTIFYELAGATGVDIWVLPVAGDRKPHVFLNGAYSEFDPRLSPDGRYLAYTSDESGRSEIYVQTYPDRAEKWQVSTRGGEDPRWSPNGREIYYLSPEQQMMSVPVAAPQFDPGVPQVLFNAKVLQPGNQRAHYAVTADGQTFIMFSPTASRALPSTTVVVNWPAEIAKR